VLSFLFLSTSLQAEEFYHFDNIARNSSIFMESSNVGIKNSQKLTGLLDTHKRISTALRTTSSMLSDGDLSKWDTIIANTHDKNNQVSQIFLNQFVQDYSASYENHTIKYLKEYPKAVSCKASPFGGGSCSGEDISAIISKKLDADKELQATVKEVNERVWPEPSLPTRSFPPISMTGTEFFVSLDVFAQSLFGKKIAGHHKWYEEQFMLLDTKDPDLKMKAEDLYKEFSEKLTHDKSTIEKALKIVVKKNKKKDPRYNSLGYCGNPKALGGCSGTDITEEVLKTLIENKKAKKIIIKAQ
jgi:hypothetical protein